MKKHAVAVAVVALLGLVFPAKAADTQSSELRLSVARFVANMVMPKQDQVGTTTPQQQADKANEQLTALIELYPQYKESLTKVRILHNNLVRSLAFDGDHRHGQLTTENSVTSVRAIAKMFESTWGSANGVLSAQQEQEEQAVKAACVQALDHLYKFGNMYAGLGYLAPEVSEWAESHAWNSDWNSHFEEWGSFYDSFSKEKIKIK